ncbi:SPFH domain-containing protein [Weissella paramesenteroides]|uniref:SPFH/Band 7/PHB domain protein n=1 Tax=Weissella paramesenteroides ATCC 33313 TaxID=585506 RepID=C5R848_WEIPA|nr:SPFH domain-containing protein [Weissella paramesenteroides]EER75632.1 SPFH/Band 7/PHB domain protein [Weissella paramesenteroides ATCC 33313]
MQESTFVKMVKGGAIVAIAGVVVTIGGFKTFEKVDNGNVGIEYSMSGGVRNQALTQGVHWVGLDKVTQYPIKSQTVKQTVSLATSDGKKTDTAITFTYHVDPSKATSVYKKFGNVDIETIEKGWLNQQLTASGRTVLSQYTLLDVVGSDSTKVQAKLLDMFRERADKQGFIIEDLSFGTPTLDPQTQKSIDDIIKAGQDNKKAQLEAETKNTQAEADAKAAKTKAKGEADATIEKANAQAEANKKINDSVNDKTIQYMEAEARKQHGWVTVQGSNGTIVDNK